MSRPSEPLLAWLRDLLKQRDLNVAALSAQAQLPRARVRRVLSGAEAMTLDELLQLTQALQIKPSDLGLPDPVGTESETGAETGAETGIEPAESPALGIADRTPVDDSGAEDGVPTIDPWGNQPRQLVQVGFALGCDFSLIVDTSQLAHSGIPRIVLERYQGGPMRIQLDAAYHSYNQPRYDEEGLTLTLSFDALYDCTFPWSALTQLLFMPAVPQAPEPPEPDAPTDGRPRLRLVT